MGEERLQRIKVGIFVIGALVIFVLGYFWISRLSLHKKKYHYQIRFKEVGWINKGDIVTVLGVPKGRVEGIELFPESVIVKIWIEDYPLREGARAWIESMGFIGQMRLGVSLGAGKVLKEGSTIEGVTKRSVGEVIADMGEFLARSDSLLAIAFHMLNLTFKDLGEATEGLLKDFHELTVSLRDVLNKFKYGVVGTKSSLDSTIRVLGRVTRQADSLISLLQQGKGTLGKLLIEDSLYMEIDSTVKSLRYLVEDMKKNPKKYLRVEVKVF